MGWAAAIARANGRIRDWYRTAVVYLPEAGGSHSIAATFDEAAKYTEIDRDGAKVVGTRPVLSVVLADLPVTPHVRDRVTIGAKTYEVTSYEPDGSGMASLPLTEV